MRISSFIKIVGFILVVLLALTIIFSQINNPDNSDDDNQNNNGDNPPNDDNPIIQERDINFTVTIPAHTPELDNIILHIGNSLFVMNEIGEDIYQHTIDPLDLGYHPEQVIEYGYSRGGFLPFAEKNFFQNATGWAFYPRSHVVNSTRLIEDTVDKWKWFHENPEDDPSIIDIPTLVNSASISDRDDFWKGIQLVDFWTEEWTYQYNSTIDYLKENGYNWVEIAPPWDIANDDPPEISGINVSVPSYPDNELREHIQVFKEHGFKIALRIQVCCTFIDGSSKDATWWDQWFDEFEDFVQYHANLSKEEGVDAIMLATYGDLGLPDNPNTPAHANASARWQDVINIAKTSEAQLGVELYAHGSSVGDDQFAWPGEYIDFFDQLDFIGPSLWGTIVNKTNPTQLEIDDGLEIIFEHLEYNYNETGLPIVIPSISYASHNESTMDKGPETFYTYIDPNLVPFEYNGTLQAMVYEGIMKQIVKRSYIQGMFPFGNWYVDAPLAVDDYSIRGKMAGSIVEEWYNKLPGNLNEVNLQVPNSAEMKNFKQVANIDNVIKTNNERLTTTFMTNYQSNSKIFSISSFQFCLN